MQSNVENITQNIINSKVNVVNDDHSNLSITPRINQYSSDEDLKMSDINESEDGPQTVKTEVISRRGDYTPSKILATEQSASGGLFIQESPLKETNLKTINGSLHIHRGGSGGIGFGTKSGLHLMNKMKQMRQYEPPIEKEEKKSSGTKSGTPVIEYTPARASLRYDYSGIFNVKEEFIFVFSGLSNKGILNTVEVFDTLRDIWRIFGCS